MSAQTGLQYLQQLMGLRIGRDRPSAAAVRLHSCMLLSSVQLAFALTEAACQEVCCCALTCEGNEAVAIDDALQHAFPGSLSAQGELPSQLLPMHAVEVHLRSATDGRLACRARSTISMPSCLCAFHPEHSCSACKILC